MLAEAYYRLGRTNDALLQLNETVRLQPKNRACWLQLFELYAQQRNWPIASHTLDQALKQLPNEPDLWAALVRMKIVANTGGSLSVVDACQTLIRLRGNAADHALYSQVLFNAGDREKSIAELKRAISLDPSNSSYATILNQITRQ
jgi:tetratricopeptide (TPR) repeat protein